MREWSLVFKQFRKTLKILNLTGIAVKRENSDSNSGI